MESFTAPLHVNKTQNSTQKIIKSIKYSVNESCGVHYVWLCAGRALEGKQEPTRELLSDGLELLWAQVQVLVCVQGGEEEEPLIPQGLQSQLLVWEEEASEISLETPAEIHSGPSGIILHSSQHIQGKDEHPLAGFGCICNRDQCPGTAGTRILNLPE